MLPQLYMLLAVIFLMNAVLIILNLFQNYCQSEDLGISSIMVLILTVFVGVFMLVKWKKEKLKMQMQHESENNNSTK